VLCAFEGLRAEQVGTEYHLVGQLMLTELAMGERARSEADSGIKQVRSTKDATKPYYLTTHTYNSVCSIHEHSNYDRTVGMGEFIATLNGKKKELCQHDDRGNVY
jgi:hypothetical protein